MMKTAYERVDSGGNVYSDRSAYLNEGQDDTEVVKVAPWKSLLFIVPLAILVIWAILGMFMEGAMIAIAICAVMYIPLKVMKFNDYCRCCMEGTKNMISPVIIIIGAFMVRDALVAMELPEYVSGAVESILSPCRIPGHRLRSRCHTVLYDGKQLGCAGGDDTYHRSYCRGNRLQSIYNPGGYRLRWMLRKSCLLLLDATVFTSAVCKIENMDHALSQLPYCLLSAGLATLAFLVTGIVIN